MKSIVILTCSLYGEVSLALKAIKLIEKDFESKAKFTEIQLNKEGTLTNIEMQTIKENDLLMIVSSTHQFLGTSQMTKMLKTLGEYLEHNSPNKSVTLLTESSIIADSSLCSYIKHWVENYNLELEQPMSLYGDITFNTTYREIVYAWANFIIHSIDNNYRFKQDSNVTIVTADVNIKTAYLIQRYKEEFEFYGAKVRIENIHDNINSCVGCGECYQQWDCALGDNFKEILARVYKDADIVLFIGEIDFGYYNWEIKAFIDRGIHFIWEMFKNNVVMLFSYTSGKYRVGDENLLEQWAYNYTANNKIVYMGTYNEYNERAVRRAMLAVHDKLKVSSMI